MKDEIKSIATELLIRHGYRGFRFREIAVRLGTTRANIHYYFGSKQRLVDEIVSAYVVSTIERAERVWDDPDLTFVEKICQMMELHRERYLSQNPTGATGHPWSLIARIRLDRELVGTDACQTTIEFSVTLEKLVRRAIRAAINKGELVAETPVNDVALQIVAIANSADPITQDAGSFQRLEQLYGGFSRIILHAYGRHEPKPASVRRSKSKK